MENQIDHSRSTFRELRQAAGYTTVTALAAKLGTPRRMLFSWERWNRPPWAYLTQLAKVFRLELRETAEAVGDLCECGCGARKILPEGFPESRRLALERTCLCGTKRIHMDTPSNHRRMCQSCARFRERVALTCVGYRDPLWKKDGAIRHGPKCRGKISLTASRLRSYQKRAQQAHDERAKRSTPGQYGQLKWAPAFRDEASRTFRCKSCARSSFAVAITEQKIKVALSGVPHGRIESQQERRELISTFHKKINPNFARSMKPWKGGGRLGTKNKRPMFWSKVFFRLGRCFVCKKLTASHGRPIKFTGLVI
jgi:hypothetical protein